jgi:hypothetical protein
MVPILYHIVIIDFHPFLFAASSSTVFPLLPEQKCTEIHLQVEVYEIIFSTIHHTHETGSEQKSCAYFTPAMQFV